MREYRRKYDLTGQRFGSWLVLSPGYIGQEPAWLCRCDRGTERSIRTHALIGGASTKCTRCAGSVLIDLTGQHFGRLTVLRHVGSGSGGYAYWRCSCECGREISTRTDYLRSGRSNSCGCLMRSARAGPNVAAWNQVYNKLKNIATRRGRNIPFELTREFIRNECSKPCHYCGAEPNQVRVGCKSRPQDAVRFNGLDRVDSNLGYTPDNVVPCCPACNFAKNTMTVEQFYVWIERIYQHSIWKPAIAKLRAS